jgi:hypothetical protein
LELLLANIKTIQHISHPVGTSGGPWLTALLEAIDIPLFCDLDGGSVTIGSTVIYHRNKIEYAFSALTLNDNLTPHLRSIIALADATNPILDGFDVLVK